MDSKKFIKTIQNRVQKFDKNVEIILFGSRARDDYRKDSDWDILILTDQILDERLKEKIRDELYEIELEFDQTISSIIQSKRNWEDFNLTPLYQNIEKEGIRL